MSPDEWPGLHGPLRPLGKRSGESASGDGRGSGRPRGPGPRSFRVEPIGSKVSFRIAVIRADGSAADDSSTVDSDIARGILRLLNVVHLDGVDVDALRSEWLLGRPPRVLFFIPADLIERSLRRRGVRL